MCVAEEEMAGGSSSVAHRKAALGTRTGWLGVCGQSGHGDGDGRRARVSGWGASS
jgi:bifunctional ADP-heptose synthase (sugar kinase/adenylyltransferase)